VSSKKLVLDVFFEYIIPELISSKALETDRVVARDHLIADLVHQVEASKKTIATLLTERSQQNEHSSLKQTQIDNLKSQVAGLQDERSILKRDLLKAGRDIKKTRDTIRLEKEEDLKKLKRDFVAMREAKDGLTFKIAAQTTRCFSLKDENTWMKYEHEHLTNKLRVARDKKRKAELRVGVLEGMRTNVVGLSKRSSISPLPPQKKIRTQEHKTSNPPSRQTPPRTLDNKQLVDSTMLSESIDAAKRRPNKRLHHLKDKIVHSAKGNSEIIPSVSGCAGPPSSLTH
jgi:hypothetical protein